MLLLKYYTFPIIIALSPTRYFRAIKQCKATPPYASSPDPPPSTPTQCLKITQNVSFEFFVLLKLTCLVTLFDRKLHVFKNSPKWTIFGIFN